jgi:hypothetical protein
MGLRGLFEDELYHDDDDHHHHNNHNNNNILSDTVFPLSAILLQQ